MEYKNAPEKQSVFYSPDRADILAKISEQDTGESGTRSNLIKN